MGKGVVETDTPLTLYTFHLYTFCFLSKIATRFFYESAKRSNRIHKGICSLAGPLGNIEENIEENIHGGYYYGIFIFPYTSE